jgi:AFG3 family protein
MLRTILKPFTRSSLPLPLSLLKPFKTLSAKPLFLFSEDSPKGFEKFQRKKKSPTPDPEKTPKPQTVDVESKEQQKQETDKPEEASMEEPPTKKEQEESNIGEGVKKAEKNFVLEEKKEEAKEKKDEGTKGSTEEPGDSKKKSSKGSKKMENPFNPQGGPDRQSRLVNIAGIIAVSTILYLTADQGLDTSPITFKEFVAFVEKDDIKVIKIKILADDSSEKPRAKIIDKNGVERNLPLLNVDNFLENLEKFQLDRGVDPTRLIPIEFYKENPSPFTIDNALKFGLYSGMLALIYYLGRNMYQTLQ